MSEEARKARKAARRLSIEEWAEESRILSIPVEPTNRADFMSGFDRGWNAHTSHTAALREKAEALVERIERGEELLGVVYGDEVTALKAELKKGS